MTNISTLLNTNNVYQDVNYVISKRINRKLKDKVNTRIWMVMFFNISQIYNNQRFNFKRNI